MTEALCSTLAGVKVQKETLWLIKDERKSLCDWKAASLGPVPQQGPPSPLVAQTSSFKLKPE